MGNTIPIKTEINLGRGQWSIAAVRADGLPAILFQQLRSQHKVGEDTTENERTDRCNVLIKFHNEAGFLQLQKILEHAHIDIKYDADPRVQEIIAEANREQEGKEKILFQMHSHREEGGEQ